MPRNCPLFNDNQLDELERNLSPQQARIRELMACFRYDQDCVLVFAPPDDLIIADNYHAFGDMLEEALNEFEWSRGTRFNIINCTGVLLQDRVPS